MCLKNGDLGGTNSPNTAPPPHRHTPAWQAAASNSHGGDNSFWSIIVRKVCQPAKMVGGGGGSRAVPGEG